MMRIACFAGCLLVCEVGGSDRGWAQSRPSIDVLTRFYSVTGRTAGQLEQAMAARGPSGYWAQTQWHVSWSARCRVRLRIVYTFPRWRNRQAGPPALRRRWDAMMRALRAHERQHGKHARAAAHEVARSRCAGNTEAIAAKWAQRDEVFDRRTNHGTLRGVRLR